jgi:hypothetical protein
VPTVANSTGVWGFDEGFTPGEYTGFLGAPATRWQISSEAEYQGGLGVRPPIILTAGGSAELTTSCGGRSHTQLEFWHAYAAELYVDGVKQDLPNSGWTRRTIPVPAGTHTYGWKVTTPSAGRPRFMLDSVTCSTP